MATDDVYGNQGKYQYFVDHYETELLKPLGQTSRVRKDGRQRKDSRKYICRNPENIKYMAALIKKLEARDISYIRRLKLCGVLKVALAGTNKDLAALDQGGLDEIIVFMRAHYKKATAQADFIRDIKTLWRWLFPETDTKGRPDSSLLPYPVRHLSSVVDPSKRPERHLKLYPGDFSKILSYFSGDPALVAFLSHAVESKARPQELLSVKLKNVELYDNFAKVIIDENKKERGGLAKCRDSFPYLLAWWQQHPFKHNKNAYLYLNRDNGQLTPFAVNKALRKACRHLELEKLTAYDLKHAGISWDALKGKPVSHIQSEARWTSLKQFGTYNHMTQTDLQLIEALKAGEITDKALLEKYRPFIKPEQIKPRKCVFCNTSISPIDDLCKTCKRPTDRQKIEQEYSELVQNTSRLQELEKKVELIYALLEAGREDLLKKNIKE